MTVGTTDDHQRIADLAMFLDPVAFQHRDDRMFAKRRQAAWREARNRLRQRAETA